MEPPPCGRLPSPRTSPSTAPSRCSVTGSTPKARAIPTTQICSRSCTDRTATPTGFSSAAGPFRTCAATGLNSPTTPPALLPTSTSPEVRGLLDHGATGLAELQDLHERRRKYGRGAEGGAGPRHRGDRQHHPVPRVDRSRARRPVPTVRLSRRTGPWPAVVPRRLRGATPEAARREGVPLRHHLLELRPDRSSAGFVSLT